MKVIDLLIRKETVADEVVLVCTITLDDGHQLESSAPWHNPRGIWASDSDQRESAEIAAHLRCFAASIDKSAKDREQAA